MKLFIYFLILTNILACSSVQKKITSVDVKRINPKCIPLAKVMTENNEGVEALAVVDAENKVRELNGDTLAVEEIIRNGKEIKFNGIAYRCKNNEE